MRQSHHRKNTVVLCTLGLVLFAIGPAGAAQPATNDPLQLVPAESLFCVRVNHLNTTISQMDQFLTGLSPIGPSMLVQSQLAQLLGGPEPNSVNMSGDFAVFGPLPGGEAPNPGRVGILVPVTDYQKFVQGNPNISPPDAQGLSKIGPQGRQQLVAVNVSGYALVTSLTNQQALTEAKTWIPRGATSLAQRLGSEELQRAQGSPVWAYANIQTVQKMFGPMIEAKIQETKGMFEQLKAQGQAPPMAANMGSIMDMYSGLLSTFLKETQSASLTLDPTATALRLELAVAALPQTEMAKIFTAGSAPMDRSFARYLQNGAMMNFLAAVDPVSWNRINNWAINLLAQMAGKSASDPEVQKIRKFSTEGTNALGGTLAGSVSIDPKSKPPFAVRYVVGLKDAQAFSRMLDQMPAIFNSGLIASFYQQMGLKLNVELQRKVETYKEVPIDALKFTFASTDPNSPQGQIIASMYGQGMDVRIAAVNNLLVYALASDPSAAMKGLIDQVKGSTSTAAVPSEIQAATQLIPASEKAEFLVTYNILRQLQMMAVVAPMPIPAPAAESQSNIVLAGNAANGRLSVQVALPKQHLQELMGAFIQMQQQRTKEQQGQQDQM